MIREYTEKDRAFLEKNNSFSALELSYHGDIVKESAFTSVALDGHVNGVLYFKYHFSWYGENEDFHRISPVICAEDVKCETDLAEYAIDWLKGQKERCVGKRAALALWVESDEVEKLRRLMKIGFLEASVCPCCIFDFNRMQLPSYPVPDGLTVKTLEFNESSVNQFVEMTKLANDGTPDSINEMWFMTGNKTYQVYMLMDGETIVSSASLWEIEEGHAAIENIVTAEAYQRRGFGRVIISYTLGKIKEQGYSIATLSMRGMNKKAHHLYQSLGFELFYNQIELLYPYEK